MSSALRNIALGSLPRFASGKVREIFDLGDELLFVATDRISAFDVIMGEGIPDKGRLLTQISIFWFDFLRDLVPNHLITADVNDYQVELQQYADQLHGRSMVVRKADVYPVECVVRGYITGSGWVDYQETGKVCGIGMPGGLLNCDKLEQPIFTPATKAASGHDQNISFERMARSVGMQKAQELKRLSLEIYSRASEYAAERGIIIADTKFEFGEVDGRTILVDEVLTPDSSRFWPAKLYKPGQNQPSFDKQYLRDYLETLDWDKTPPPPNLPAGIISRTREKYLEAYERLTGEPLEV